MKKGVKIIAETTTLIMGLALAGCSSSQAAKTPQIPLSEAIATMDSSKVTDADSMNVVQNVESGLTRLDNSQPTLDLAKSITTSKDGLTLTIKLRPNLKWSNGDKLVAQDFVYA